MPVCESTWFNMAPTWQVFWNYIMGRFYWHLSRKCKFGSSQTKINGSLHVDLHTWMATVITNITKVFSVCVVGMVTVIPSVLWLLMLCLIFWLLWLPKVMFMWLLWLCEHTRIVFLCRISYLVSAYTYFLMETIWRSASCIIYKTYTFGKPHNTLISCPHFCNCIKLDVTSRRVTYTICWCICFVESVILVLGQMQLIGEGLTVMTLPWVVHVLIFYTPKSCFLLVREVKMEVFNFTTDMQNKIRTLTYWPSRSLLLVYY